MHTNGISKSIFWGLVGLFCAAVTATAEVKQGTALVKNISGSATYIDSFGIAQPLAVGSVVKQGQTIRTGADSSVTLFLAENGPTVGLESGSELLLEKLASWQSPLETMIDTRLDLKQGRLYGKVDKLLPGSNYEVKTPKDVAKVRGTEFYVDASSGNVYVVTGTVTVTVTLQGPINSTPGQNSRTFMLQSGQQLIFPSNFKNLADFDSFAPSTMSPNQIAKLSQLGFVHYPNAQHPNASAVTEVFSTAAQGGKYNLNKPPATTVSP